jgi:tRNA nucleotidyltransferase (CCA-adding enzyme)
MPPNLAIPEDLRAMLEVVRRNGRPRLVGGGVRDWLLGLAPNDFDIEVSGIDFETLHRTLAPFGPTDIVGRSFGVIKVRSRATSEEYDFSLPRRESKTGAGHRGFIVAPDPALSDAEASARRDFTLNAIALDPFTGALIDPHGGQRDLAARILRHTSEAFVEDPLRVLRAFQLAARFDFTLAAATANLCRTLSPAFTELPVERVWVEWEKWAAKSTKPSRGLAVLAETSWLAHFPAIAALQNTPQEPAWHPEGDVFTHTQHCLDALVALPEWRFSAPARKQLLSFAVLAHDFGKPSTTAQVPKNGVPRWTSPGHEAAGGPIAVDFLRRLGAPLRFDAPVSALVVNHLAHHHGAASLSDAAVRRLARRLHPTSIDDLAAVMRADANGRPPLQSPEILDRINELVAKARHLELERLAPKPILLGRHLIALGRPAGPHFTKIIAAAFEAQLDGAFHDEASGTVWLQAFLASDPLTTLKSPPL